MTDRNGRMATRGRVYLVGAGPGNPELLTIRALRILQSADFVLYDALVSAEVLALASADAELEDVGKRCGEKRMSQTEIHARMIDLARAGFAVARLQGGDPAVFGRIGEEIAALIGAGVQWEIIPGITSASAAAAAAGVPLTDRRTAGQLILLAGRHAGEGIVDIPAPVHGGATVAVYMPSCSYAELAARFLDSGWRRGTPCVICSEVSTSRQRILRSTLQSLAECDRLPAPSILIVGETAGAGHLAETKTDVENAVREILAAAM
jgi:uroporphyrin-III C-methyltransferase